MDYSRILVVSIGTGSAKNEKKYSADVVNKWGPLGWLLNGSVPPLAELFAEASADMVDYHVSVAFQALHCHGNYLRVQVRPLMVGCLSVSLLFFGACLVHASL